MNTHATHGVAGLALLAGLSCTMVACTSVGYGQGALLADRTSVAFDWASQDGGKSGTMSAYVGFGLQLRGPFGEVAHVSPDGLTEAPLIAELRDPAPSPRGGVSQAANNTEVIADLIGSDGHSLVCSFQVNDPARGMRSGARGECLFDGTRRLRAGFPAS